MRVPFDTHDTSAHEKHDNRPVRIRAIFLGAAVALAAGCALAISLLPVNLQKLGPKFLALPPGTPIVNNGYRIPGWEEKEVGVAGDCGAWCTAYLYLVPAQVAGTWRLAGTDLVLEQEFQAL